jgi:hypothetical protein
MTDSLYVRDGDVFEPTGNVRGPWSYDHCHGGPPAALLTSEIVRTRPDMAMTRMTIDIPGPVPIVPVRVETRVLRPGKKISHVAATLVDLEGTIFASAAGWLMRIDEHVFPATTRQGAVPRRPDESSPVLLEFWDGDPQYGHAVDIRAAAGTPFSGGPATAWIRLRMPLVAGEDTHPSARVLAVSDFPNGISALAPFDQLLCVNTDLTVYLGRNPIGDWIALQSTTNSSGLGLGMTDSLLYDASGFIGTANQSIFFDSLLRREPKNGA